MKKRALIALGVLRVMLGWIFLWAFLDKTFGLGFATAGGKAWVDGASPTSGFLTHATQGPFATAFQSLAGQPWVDWLFMIGLLLIGLALILGIGVRIACATGSLLLALMYLATLWPDNNPILDDHLIYIAALCVIYCTPETWDLVGFGRVWKNLGVVKKFPWLA